MLSEVEKYFQELRLKDFRFYEVEEKLKVYLEVGERMEVFEFEFLYIRNFVTVFRELFFLKDFVFQRIEEILEDFELLE